MRQHTNTIGAELAKSLPGFVFQKTKGQLIRKTAVGWQAVAFEVIPTASPGFGKLAASAQIRIDALESLYAPLHPLLSPVDAQTHATLITSCDRLLKDQALTHGFSLDAATLDAFGAAYAHALREDVLPWLERHSDIPSLYQGLADPDPMKWITSDRLTRYPVLLAILAQRGDPAAFDQIATEFLQWCQSKHALVHTSVATALLKLRPPTRDNSGLSGSVTNSFPAAPETM